MSTHRARISWQRDGVDFAYATYSRDHLWEFENGQRVRASAAPAFLGNAGCVDPEEAFTAALSSCHMLTFLALAANRGFVVDRYVDEAEGELGKNSAGRTAVIRVVLRPRIEFAGDAPDAPTLAALHERAHRGCFIANSVRTPIEVQ